jgi:membrane-associated protein
VERALKSIPGDMVEAEARSSGTRGRTWLWVAGGLLLIAIALSLLNKGDVFALIQANENVAYVMVFALIAGDAVFPVFPGETTLNTASTLAAQGELKLGWVIVAGALGAIVGDSMLFLLARRQSGRLQPQLDRALSNDKVAAAYAYLDRGAPMLLVFGRYVPGLRFVINVTMGLSPRPYRKFIPWSALGGALWSTYTCLLAYWVGTKLDDYPAASVILSGVITTLLMLAFFLAERHRNKHA